MSEFRSHKWYLQEDPQLVLFRAVRRWLQERVGPVEDCADWHPTFKGKDTAHPSYFQLLDLRGWDPAGDQNDTVRRMLIAAVCNRSAARRLHRHPDPKDLTFEIVVCVDQVDAPRYREQVRRICAWLDAQGVESTYIGDFFEGEYYGALRQTDTGALLA